MAAPQLPIETDRLVLRGFEAEDVDAARACLELPDVQRYLDWTARDAVEWRGALAAMSKRRRLNRPGDAISLAVARRSDRLLIGHVSLTWMDATAGQAELRFAFNTKYRGRGYAREALGAALDLGFGEFRFHRIFARCSARHAHSARLLEGLGMRLEAHFREHAVVQGEWDEELLFAVLDREWRRGEQITELTRHRVA